MDPEEKLKEYLKRGAVLADVYFDLHAKNEEQLKDIATGFSAKIVKEEGVLYGYSEIEKPIKQNDVYSTYIKARLLLSSPGSLMRLVAKYNPVGVDIIKPEELKVDIGDFTEAMLFISKIIFDLKYGYYEKIATPEKKVALLQMVKHRELLGKKLREKNDQNRDSEAR
jgi:hypothetical protein